MSLVTYQLRLVILPLIHFRPCSAVNPVSRFQHCFIVGIVCRRDKGRELLEGLIDFCTFEGRKCQRAKLYAISRAK